ncbi:hypothetical protein [Streptomyces olivoreticuli]|uniref:hypothetical protein n=1 Tax=Streptomyces olivoreticuli TaxID=68246 RepID=UPI000E27FE9B|nr:hypothetical protein [Streptomyces olivoreticuli]
MICKMTEGDISWMAMAYEIPERIAEHAILMHGEVEQIIWRAYAVRHGKDGNDVQAMEMWQRHLGPQDFRDLEEIAVDMAAKLCLEGCRRPGHGQHKRRQPRRPRVLTTGRQRVTIH